MDATFNYSQIPVTTMHVLADRILPCSTRRVDSHCTTPLAEPGHGVTGEISSETKAVPNESAENPVTLDRS
jgi:hypothetical protein